MIEMYKGIANSPETELTEGISAQATIIKVNNINAFPDGPNLATIGTDENAETIKYAAKTTNALSGCQRGVEGTARTWQSGEKIARNFTNKDHEDLISNIMEVEEKASQAFQSASEGKKKIAQSITGKGVLASENDTFPQLAGKITQIKQGRGNAQPADVLIGKTFSNDQGDQTGAMTNQGNWSSNMSISGRVAIPQGYHAGGGVVTAHVVPGQTIMPRTYEQTAINAGRMAKGDIRIAGDSDLQPGNIKLGVDIFGVRGTDDGGRSIIANALTNKGAPTDTNATPEQIVNNIISLKTGVYMPMPTDKSMYKAVGGEKYNNSFSVEYANNGVDGNKIPVVTLGHTYGGRGKILIKLPQKLNGATMATLIGVLDVDSLNGLIISVSTDAAVLNLDSFDSHHSWQHSIMPYYYQYGQYYKPIPTQLQFRQPLTGNCYIMLNVNRNITFTGIIFL